MSDARARAEKRRSKILAREGRAVTAVISELVNYLSIYFLYIICTVATSYFVRFVVVAAVMSGVLLTAIEL